MIVATAGHVDHGKTALVRALTGVDTDQLPEEKTRGLTIDLGFAYLPLPSGRIVGFVDVPGHERFVRNMVAGVAGIDSALLVVAADDGVMPQTREHAAVLSLLGVATCLVALSKADRVERERLDRVAADVRALLKTVGIEPVAVVETVAPGNVGVTELRAAIEARAERSPPRGTEGGFRLAVDRSFVVAGAGVVVTGIVHAGEARVGDRLALLPRGREVRVRGLRVQGAGAERARKGERAALNLAGIGRGEAARGDWIVAPDILAPSRRIDVEVFPLAEETGGLDQRVPVHVHHGSGHATGRLALLGRARLDAGERGLAQLVTDAPLVAARGDRIVLRDRSARRTIAGALVLDPTGPARGRAREARLGRLRLGAIADPRAALAATLAAAPHGVDLDAFLRARNLPPGAAWGRRLPEGTRDLAPALPGTVVLERHWSALTAACVEAVRRDHETREDRLGPTAAELRRAIPSRPSAALLDAVLREAARDGALIRRGAVAHLPGRKVEPGRADAALWSRARPLLDAGPGSPPALHPLAASLALQPADLGRFLDRMVGLGLVVKIAANRYLTPERIEEAVRRVDEAARLHPGGFTAAQFRDVAGVGRNFAIDLLEYMDRRGVTRRRGDLRAPGTAP